MFSDLISFTPKFQNNFAASTTGDSKWMVHEPNLEKKTKHEIQSQGKNKIKDGVGSREPYFVLALNSEMVPNIIFT